MADLFGVPAPKETAQKLRPLADRLRPARLEDVVGQEHRLAGRQHAQGVADAVEVRTEVPLRRALAAVV